MQVKIKKEDESLYLNGELSLEGVENSIRNASIGGYFRIPLQFNEQEQIYIDIKIKDFTQID